MTGSIDLVTEEDTMDWRLLWRWLRLLFHIRAWRLIGIVLREMLYLSALRLRNHLLRGILRIIVWWTIFDIPLAMILGIALSFWMTPQLCAQVDGYIQLIIYPLLAMMVVLVIHKQFASQIRAKLPIIPPPYTFGLKEHLLMGVLITVTVALTWAHLFGCD